MTEGINYSILADQALAAASEFGDSAATFRKLAQTWQALAPDSAREEPPAPAPARPQDAKSDPPRREQVRLQLGFAIIGAQRAGTSWAYSRLSMHPKVYFPLGKEINFWNRYDTLAEQSPWFFDLYSARFRSKFFSSGDGHRLGDVSPMYAPMTESCIDAFYRHCPDASVVYVLRHPVVRTWSARKFSVKHGKIDQKGLEVEALRKALQEREIQRNNDFVGNLERWRRAAERHGGRPPTALFYDQLLASPQDFVQELCQAIGLDGAFYHSIPQDIIAERVNTSTDLGIPPELYEAGLEICRPELLKLQDMLKVDLGRWLDPARPCE